MPAATLSTPVGALGHAVEQLVTDAVGEELVTARAV
jgi:hypothetical protein